ncbi:hypothetical protein AAFF_G00102450 [Aldrovandia affinis]|uniref:APC membrane recruitment protein 2 n=1 Tax=Aldrovandia affinis TaxID=143900 RepID=A0AAD7RUJ8_9TELE|nr:hypothetical protein AAFF_G00102450 [Aldrovandia affinis]
MDLQSESDPQPSGKINKAAFKLFGKRKSGSPVSSIFSTRSKGERAKGVAKAPLVRSKTHDGIIETTAVLKGSKEEESAGGNQLHTTNEAGPVASPRTSFSSVSSVKSLSFFSLLRRRRAEGDLSESQSSGRCRRGLKGLFSSVRWHRRDQGTREEQEEPPPPTLLLASRSNSVEIVKEHMTLTPRPPPRTLDASTPQTPETNEELSTPATGHAGSPVLETARRVKGGQGDKRNKVLFLDTALGPKDLPARMLIKVIADTKEAGDKATCTSSRTEDIRVEQEGSRGQGTDSGGDRDGLKGKVSDATSSPDFEPAAASTKAMICMDKEEEVFCQDKVVGRAMTCIEKGEELVRQDGVVGGVYTDVWKKVASQDKDIDAQSQGLQHLMLQKVGCSPALPPPAQPGPHRPEKRPPPVKALGLSKIPVSGCTRVGKQPREAPPEEGRSKDLQDTPPNYDEGYWDSPTPGAEEEGASFLVRDSSGSSAPYDLYNLEESPCTVATGEQTTLLSRNELKLTLSMQASVRSLRANSSLPRDSKIPVKQSHAASPGMPTPATTPVPTPHTHGAKAEVLRTKIPMSKVPVRRTTTRPATLQDHHRK